MQAQADNKSDCCAIVQLLYIYWSVYQPVLCQGRRCVSEAGNLDTQHLPSLKMISLRKKDDDVLYARVEVFVVELLYVSGTLHRQS